MKVTVLSANGRQYPLRRLSTPSDVLTTLNACTRWLWYEKNGDNWNFIKHGQYDDNFYHLALSDYLEREYQNNKPNLILSKLSIDFSNMTLGEEFNGVTHHKDLRRRPLHLQNPHNFDEKETKFLNMWSSTECDSKIFSRETVEQGTYEYNFVCSMLQHSMSPKIQKVERIENSTLWQKYELKKMQLLLENDGDDSKLSEQYLFHGTKLEVLDPISEQNLDWRLYATNVGCMYGRGCYFTYQASTADGYASGHPKVILVMMVLIGEACVGNSSMDLPPENSRTGRPFDSTVNKSNGANIFVKYDNDEYYPAYAVHYTW